MNGNSLPFPGEGDLRPKSIDRIGNGFDSRDVVEKRRVTYRFKVHERS